MHKVHITALLPTLSACWAALREAPARLMLPKAPKAGKRIFLERLTPLWKRMKFTHKVTARNLFRYKKRFFMTVIGIAGCTALLVTGFGVKDSISDIVHLQFDELNQYQLIVALKDESALEGRDLQAILEDDSQVEDYLTVLQDSGQVVPRGGDPVEEALRAARRVAEAHIPAVVIDTERQFVSLGLAAQVAQVMGAPCYRVEELRARPLAQLVRGHSPAAG